MQPTGSRAAVRQLALTLLLGALFGHLVGIIFDFFLLGVSEPRYAFNAVNGAVGSALGGVCVMRERGWKQALVWSGVWIVLELVLFSSFLYSAEPLIVLPLSAGFAFAVPAIRSRWRSVRTGHLPWLRTRHIGYALVPTAFVYSAFVLPWIEEQRELHLRVRVERRATEQATTAHLMECREDREQRVTFLRKNSLRLAQYRPSGEVDGSFHPLQVFGSGVGIELVSLRDGGAVIAGAYAAPEGTDDPPAAILERGMLHRIQSDGAIDSKFNQNLPEFVRAMKISASGSMAQSDGAIVVAGWLHRDGCAEAAEKARPDKNHGPVVPILRFTSDGTWDSHFDDSFLYEFAKTAGGRPSIGNLSIDALAADPNDRMLMAGVFFSQFDGTPPRYHSLIRFEKNGKRDEGFESKPSGFGDRNAVGGLFPLSDGSTLVFGCLSGAPEPQLTARYFRADGTFDEARSLRLERAIGPEGGCREPHAVSHEADGGFYWAGSRESKKKSFGKESRPFRVLHIGPGGDLDSEFSTNVEKSLADCTGRIETISRVAPDSIALIGNISGCRRFRAENMIFLNGQGAVVRTVRLSKEPLTLLRAWRREDASVLVLSKSP